MNKFARIIRLISLSMLFGGGSAIVFAAITLVHAAKAQGIPVNEAAAANAPIFIEFAKVAAAFAIALVAAEAVEIKGDLHNLEKRSRWPMARYFSSIIAAVATFIFAFAIVPPMSDLQPKLRTEATAQAEFKKLHEISRLVFSVMIVFSLVSLVVPVLSSSRNIE
jgi:hypothetical protein